MYKWKIDIVLKSGKELTVYYKGKETNTTDVAKAVMTGNKDTMNGFGNKDGTENIFVVVGEIASMSISIA